VMRWLSAFSGTLLAWVIATSVTWVHRSDVLGFWSAPLLEPGVPGLELHDPAALLAANIQVTLATAALLTFPVLGAEAWLLVCRLTRRADARRLTLPFALVSTAAGLLALWLAQQSRFWFVHL
jgi:Sec-independent protein secretion pathway component TatC